MRFFRCGVILLLSWMLAPFASACTCIIAKELTEKEAVHEAFAKASAVFEGQVTSVEIRDPSKSCVEREPAENFVTLVVLKRYKGPDQKNLVVRTSLSTCGFPFQKNAKYLVYAISPEGESLVTSICNRTRELEKAAGDRSILKKLPPQPTPKRPDPDPQTARFELDYASLAKEAVRRRLALNAEADGNPVIVSTVGYPDHQPFHANTCPSAASPIVSGRVVDAHGAAVPGAHLTLRIPLLSSPSPIKLETDGEGAFQTNSILAGKYDFVAEKSGYQTARSTLWVDACTPNVIRVFLSAEGDPAPSTVEPATNGPAISVAVCRGETLSRWYRVTFAGPLADLREFPESGAGHPLRNDQARTAGVQDLRQSLYYQAANIRAASNRLEPFIATRVGEDSALRALFGADATNEEIRSVIALWLDVAAHQVWMQLEGFDVPRLAFTSGGGLRPVDQLKSDLSRARAEMRQKLEDQGALEAHHLLAVWGYVMAMLGDGPALEIPPQAPDQLPTYVLPFWGSPSLNLHFALRDGLKLVSITIGD